MVIIYSEINHLSIHAARATMAWTSSLVTTVHVISQPAASVKTYWSRTIMSLSIILKYWMIIKLRRLENIRFNNIRLKLKPYLPPCQMYT